MISINTVDSFDEPVFAYRPNSGYMLNSIVRVIVHHRIDGSPPFYIVARPSEPLVTWRTQFLATSEAKVLAKMRGAAGA